MSFWTGLESPDVGGIRYHGKPHPIGIVFDRESEVVQVVGRDDTVFGHIVLPKRVVEALAVLEGL